MITKAKQEEIISHACMLTSRRNNLDFLLEDHSRQKSENVLMIRPPKVIQRFYDIGIYPDWWKLEPMKNEEAWEATCAAIFKQ